MVFVLHAFQLNFQTLSNQRPNTYGMGLSFTHNIYVEADSIVVFIVNVHYGNLYLGELRWISSDWMALQNYENHANGFPMHNQTKFNLTVEPYEMNGNHKLSDNVQILSILVVCARF